MGKSTQMEENLSNILDRLQMIETDNTRIL